MVVPEVGKEHRLDPREADIDGRHAERDGRPAVEFSWVGSDDNDDAYGRGWVRLESDGSLVGHVYFHRGDDSGFRAVRKSPA